MNIPGFAAEATLYNSNVRYHDTTEAAVFHEFVQPASPVSDVLFINRPAVSHFFFGKDLVSIDSPFHNSPFLICGGLGQTCCHAPKSLQNLTAFGPLVSCDRGLGCDITTDRCVSSCGSPGQACCDGPETRALKWTTEGKVYSPNSWNMREMCNEGVCDKQTHRCITCGTTEGGPCCATDAAQVTPRCYRDAKTGNRLVCHNRWEGDSGGMCIACGKWGQPVCLTRGEAPCDDGLVKRESDGTCVLCGLIGQPPCDRGEPCRDGQAVPNKSYSECIPAGGPNQPCRSDGGCNYQGLFCNSGRICQPCGRPGEVCCPPGRLSGNAACIGSSECRDNRCFACGYDNMPVCLNGTPCYSLSEPEDGWCRPCGKDGQRCCQSSTIIGRCLDGRCDDGVCRRPSSPPPSTPGQWKTCNGEDWGFSTMDRTVFIKHPANQCIDGINYKANSAQEAYTCARRDYGDAVVTETIYPYRFALTSQFGCSTVSFLGTDDASAQTCAQWQCINCVVTPGDCP